MSDKDNFEYTYQSKEKTEVLKIRNKYITEENKLDTLKKLDKKVSMPGTIISIISGIIGTLIFGVGMCYSTVWENIYLGAIIGVAGLLIMGLAYPLNTIITNSRKKKFAPEIIRLSDEIINEKK